MPRIRASDPCSHPRCPNAKPCPEHQPKPWAGSNRRRRLPPNWAAIRAAVLQRDHGICHICGQPGANEVDHIEPGDDHSMSNLAAIHDDPCHRTKSGREGNAARRQA